MQMQKQKLHPLYQLPFLDKHGPLQQFARSICANTTRMKQDEHIRLRILYIQNLTNNGYKCICHSGVLEGKMRRKMHYNPQNEGEILLAITSNTPCPIWPLFNFSNASCAMLKPAPALSTAVRLIDTPVAVLVRFQHEPQLGEFHTTSKAPPRKGKDGTSPNVGNRAARPFGPFEHATPFSELSLLSYVVSYVARRDDDTLGPGWLPSTGFDDGS
jgi:hypothetical protein